MLGEENFLIIKGMTSFGLVLDEEIFLTIREEIRFAKCLVKKFCSL